MGSVLSVTDNFSIGVSTISESNAIILSNSFASIVKSDGNSTPSNLLIRISLMTSKAF